MNYYNPYLSSFPNYAASSSTGMFSKLFGAGGIKWGSILSGTQKILGVANQAIPVIKQVTPVMKNAKTMFKVMNEFKKIDTPSSVKSNTIKSKDVSNNDISKTSTTTISNDGPTFFI